jgi:TFIIF, beta subunit HTH domain
MLFVLFGEFRIWKFKELKARTGQAQRPLEEGLRVIAIKHTSGDFANMWELKDIYKNKPELLSARDVAPDTVGDSDVDRSGVEDGDDDDDEANVKFEDVMTEAAR